MSSNPKAIKNFQLHFLKFLRDKTAEEVHIYNELLSFWGNTSSMLTLQELKQAISDLCYKKLIMSPKNTYSLVGELGVPEDEQKNKAICIILERGRRYLKITERKRKIKAILILALLLAATIYLICHYFRLANLLS